MVETEKKGDTSDQAKMDNKIEMQEEVAKLFIKNLKEGRRQSQVLEECKQHKKN